MCKLITNFLFTATAHWLESLTNRALRVKPRHVTSPQ